MTEWLHLTLPYGIIAPNSDLLVWGWSWPSGFISLPRVLQVQPRVRINWFRGNDPPPKEGPGFLQFSPGSPPLTMPSRGRQDRFTACITGPLRALSENEPLPTGLMLELLLLSRVWLFETPWTAACHAALTFIISWCLLKLMSIELVMPSNHLILCHPPFAFSLFQDQGIFKWAGSSHQNPQICKWPQLCLWGT